MSDRRMVGQAIRRRMGEPSSTLEMAHEDSGGSHESGTSASTGSSDETLSWDEVAWRKRMGLDPLAAPPNPTAVKPNKNA